MKAVLLAGGYGTRISEESGVRPKPMVEIGGKPILWHIMKIYSAHGINEFIICCGYKGHIIKEYFANYSLYNSDVTFDMRNNSMEVHQNNTEDWKVTLVHTGHNSMTGGRLKRVKNYIGDETFCMTYGDGLSDIDITESIKFHKQQGTMATLTAVQQPGRFGTFNLGTGDDRINSFMEKPSGGEMPWINGGFFVLEPGVIDYIEGDNTTWEREPMEGLARDGELSAYRHTGFWQPMDTLRDKVVLEEMWQSGKAPWYNLVFNNPLSKANSY
ncbi:glucose-1-phosphate cytidylyltransferase [Adhaeribacter aerolatus]|uniref:Glucose-1-phosphate cytidylyltransferase n=1 Tax=Adhaeribacter aerolatus TaxID=670289 RepID=A0A512AWD0_9BACT|nr:glucose-1-phosphate cytidylyltransferase [Adhaeribacter aerolatus]GEO04028.1 glucose-1-phosphate cytidylyltransferase [Adhaeribacter aerolatus]